MRLPSTRALADELSISRNTVLNAYQQLFAEGYVNSTVGNGTFVAQVLPEHLLTSPEPKDFVDTRPAEPRKPRFSDQAALQLAAPRMSTVAIDPGGASPRPFRFGVPALQAFPYKLWIGSLSLCRSLLKAGLVDRFQVVVFPVITGSTGYDWIYDGYPDVALDMVASRTFDGRIQLLEYVPTVLAGQPGTNSGS